MFLYISTTISVIKPEQKNTTQSPFSPFHYSRVFNSDPAMAMAVTSSSLHLSLALRGSTPQPQVHFLPRRCIFRRLGLKRNLVVRAGGSDRRLESKSVLQTRSPTLLMVSENGGEVSRVSSEEMERLKMNRICDKLIDVFLVEKTNPEEWHIYLAFSKEWVNIRPHFFSRCKFQAAQAEDLKRRSNLLTLSRRLKELDEDMQQHDKLLALLEQSPTKIDTIVARQRKDFTEHFFEHLRIRIQASYDDQNRREEIAAIAKKCLAAVQEYDKNAKDFMSLSAAQMKFDDIVKSPSLEIASKKIEDLAKKGELDSSLMLLISKAYSASKESTLMKEEAKDTMLQLYNVARGNMSRLVPKEVRILRYLLSINDPQERSSEMKNAFTPGLELEGKDVDELYTTPEALSMTIQNLLDAFDTNRQGALLKEARKLIQPSVIGRLRSIKQELESQYM